MRSAAGQQLCCAALPQCQLSHTSPVLKPPHCLVPLLVQRAAAPAKKAGTTKKAAGTGTTKKSVLGSVFGSRG